MSDYKVTDTQLASIANAIRAKTGKSAQIEFPTEFVSEIGSISGGTDANYVYIDTADHTLGMKINSDGTRVLYFNGYHKTSSGYDESAPSPVDGFIPSGNKGTYVYGSDKETPIANAGYYNGVLRFWSIDFSSPAPAGYYWGVLYMDSPTNPQTNPYEEPLVSNT